jgi:hypothetical protein
MISTAGLESALKLDKAQSITVEVMAGQICELDGNLNY